MIFLLLFSCGRQEKNSPGHEKHTAAEHTIRLTEDEMQKAGIRLDTVRMKTISEKNIFTGTVSVNERNVTQITSPVSGRLDVLHIRSEGQYVEKGMPLYEIYSEELLSVENEYLLALEQLRNARTQKEISRQLAEGARKKLLSWTLTEEQVIRLEQTGKASPRIAFFAKEGGYVTALFVREGDYVETGASVASIAGRDPVWVDVQVYSNETEAFRKQEQISVEFEAFPGKHYEANVVLEKPALEPDRKIGILHLEIKNPENKIRPGMMAYVRLSGEGKKTIVAPKSSLLIEQSVSVWVQVSPGLFEHRMVKVGIENKSEAEIVSGLKEGEVVVSNGVWFLKSEWAVQQGSGSMEGMKM